jgi:hypothetical protein
MGREGDTASGRHKAQARGLGKMTKQHKAHKKHKPSLHTHGRKNHRAAKSHRGGGDSGFGSALAGLTSIGHGRGY